jgi:dipeptide/tripeptide permease
MITYLKAQTASIAGSLADYLLTIFLVTFFHWWYVLANAAGNILGSVILFLLCRSWAFGVGKTSKNEQIVKFILVWMGNILLSAAGIYFLTHFLNLNYLLSKTIVSVSLGLTYNYLMQKKFVFV